MEAEQATTLWRPTGPAELALVCEADWRTCPPRLPEQPIFYPMLSRDYAVRIARDWNAPRDGVGYVTRFKIRTAFLGRYQVQQVGGRSILECWIPAEDRAELNANLLGVIEVTDEFRTAG